MNGNGVSASEVAALKVEVDGIRRDVSGLTTQISALAAAINERSKTPWAIIISGAGTSLLGISLVGGLIAWGLSVQTSGIVAQSDAKLSALEDKIDTFKETYEANRVISRQDQDARWARNDALLARSVPREEHEKIWDAQTRTDADQQRQIEEVKTAAGSTYSLRDYIQRLTERIDTLEQRSLYQPNRP